MVSLAWRMLRQRPASAVATFLAAWFCVAVVTACGVLLESGLRYHGTPARYAASTALIASTDLRTVHGRGKDREVERAPLPGRGQVDASLVSRAAQLPGVRVAVADVAAPVQLLAVGIAASAHPWSAAVLTPFTLRAGTAPAADDQVVVDTATASRAGLRPGSPLRLVTSRGVETVTVSGVAAAIGAGPDGATLFTTDRLARALAGHPATVDVIGVIAEPGISARTLARDLTAIVPKADASTDGAYARVYTGADRGLVETPAVGDGRELAVALSSVFGGCTLFIAVLVIAGTVGLSVQQRHRDIALLRAIAATPRQVRRMVVRETALIALLAAASGVWGGFAGVSWLRDQFIRRGMTQADFAVHVSWLPPLVAAAATVLIAVVAAWIASLRASRIRPTEALVEAAVERRRAGWLRALLGLVALAGGITLSIVSMNGTGDSAAGVAIGVVCTLTTAVAMLAPWLNRAGAGVASLAFRGFGVTGRLAAANAGASARRLSSVVSAVVLAVGLGGSMWFVQTSITHRAAQENRAGLLADYVVTPSAGGLPASAAATLSRLPGVDVASGVVRSTMLSGSKGADQYPVQGIDASAASRVLDLDLVSGSLADLRGAAVAVDRLTAQTLGLRVGDEWHAWFGDGTPATLRVVALYTRGLGFAAMTLPADVLRPHAGGLDSAVLVRAGAATELAGAAASFGGTVVDRHGYQAAISKNVAQSAWANRVIVGVLLIYVVIAAVNTLVMAAAARRREFAVLRLNGTTRPQLLRMVSLEQALLLGISLLIGAAIAAATLVPMVQGLTGDATPYIPFTGWVAVIGGTVLLSCLATAVPIRHVLRANPVEAIGLREA